MRTPRLEDCFSVTPHAETVSVRSCQATPCLQNPRMGSVRGCISTGQGAARYPIASISALTAVLFWGTNLGYCRRRLERWRSGGSARRRARTSLGGARCNTAPEVLLRQAVHAAGGRFRLHRQIARAAPRTSSCRRAASPSSWTAASGTGVPSTAARRPGPGPTPSLWADKMRRNAERDRRSTQLAQRSRMARREGVGVPGAPGPGRRGPRGHESTGARPGTRFPQPVGPSLMEYLLRGDASPLAHRVDPVGCARPEDSAPMNDALPLHFNLSAPKLDLAVASAKLAGYGEGLCSVQVRRSLRRHRRLPRHARPRRRTVRLRLGDRPRGAPDLPAQLGGPAAGVAQPHRQHRHHHGDPDDGPVDVPPHDVLAAGFPCQPFSKSGYQRGMDEARGTLFWNIARILEDRTPAVVLLENVRNLAGPRQRHEWDVIIQTLREIGYRVSSTPSVFSPHFLPPSLGGTPQVRDRVFILGTYVGPERALAEVDVPPTVVRAPVDGWNVQDWDVEWILDDDSSIPNLAKYQLTADETEWINVWDDLVQRMWSARGVAPPGLPALGGRLDPGARPDPIELDALPRWKSDILIKNARFFDEHRDVIETGSGRTRLRDGSPSRAASSSGRRRTPASLWETVDALPPSGHPRQGADLPARLGRHHPDVDHRRPAAATHAPGGGPAPGASALVPFGTSATRPRTSRSATAWPSVRPGTCFAPTLPRTRADLPKRLVNRCTNQPATLSATIVGDRRRPELKPTTVTTAEPRRVDLSSGAESTNQ